MSEMTIGPRDALVVVDPQNDFLPGGSLAVPDGNRIFGPINALLPAFARVYATRDWHSRDHAFFQAEGGPWPYHCIAGTAGAEFSPLLDRRHVDCVVDKGTERTTDGYSAFAGTDLASDLRAHGVARIFVCGLATDYCVKVTTLDARALGFDVVVLTDAIAAIDLHPGDGARALEAMRAAGVTVTTSRLCMP